MIYQRIKSINDTDIPYLTSILDMPEISRYISIDRDNYWNYVTMTDNVFYFKAYSKKALVGAVHLEVSGETLYMDIMVIPELQGKGIGTTILRDVLTDKLITGFKSVEVSIDKSNIASARLFEKMGFIFKSEDDGLLNYVYFK